MTGIAQTGAQLGINAITKQSIPVVQNTAPTWVPGLYWVDTSSGNAVKEWNGSAWAVAAATGYLALLSADPSGQSTIAGLTEDTTTGYARIPVTFSAAAASTPAVASNSSLLAFGPYTANQALPCQWLALVTVSTGTLGFLLQTWTLSTPQQVSSTQTIDIAAGALQITES
jgi:hypothetical protein